MGCASSSCSRTSEFLIAVAASLGFLFGLGGEGIDYAWVAALLAGGVVAAPDDVRYVIYAVIYGLWAAAAADSFKQYQAHRERVALASA